MELQEVKYSALKLISCSLVLCNYYCFQSWDRIDGFNDAVVAMNGYWYVFTLVP